MYRVLQRRILDRLVNSHSKRFPEYVRPYCNQINNDESIARRGDDVDSRDEKLSQGTNWTNKIVYSSFLEAFLPYTGYRRALEQRFKAKEAAKNELISRTTLMPPVAVQYMLGEDENKETPDDPTEGPQFPFKISSKTKFTDDITIENEAAEKEDGKAKLLSVADKLKREEIDIGSVLGNSVEEPSLADASEDDLISEIGTADPNVPASNIPCGGCGAMLHCQDQSAPGYISSEKFTKARKRDLMQEVCYRCSTLETHKATLEVNVSSEDYPRIVSKIRETFSMVLLLVDLTDFPCSIWPGLLDIIGNRRPVFLVGNKVDMIPQDSPDYLRRLEESLIKSAVEVGMVEANIIHTALISAKTGYGVENLITKLFNVWGGKGDIFIMGCTNVGKSSLFNIFLQSDLCRPKVAGLVQTATVSQWPGTTLNLLKFPMTGASGWRKELRKRRMMAESHVLHAEGRERLVQYEITGNPELITLSGYVGKTFISTQQEAEMKESLTTKDMFQINLQSRNLPNIKRPGQWDPDDIELKTSKWVYDTPGAVNANQILDLLTLRELTKSLPRTLIKPRTFYIKPEMSFFIGGLVRVDYLEGDAPIRYTLFASPELQVTMTCISDAEEVYHQATGTKVFGVPCGNEERMRQFPGLSSRDIHLRGINHSHSCADIVLSSIGWVAVTTGQHKECNLRIHTPDGRGIFIRQPALLPYAVNWKGKRLRGTYAYLPHKIYNPSKMYRIKRPGTKARLLPPVEEMI